MTAISKKEENMTEHPDITIARPLIRPAARASFTKCRRQDMKR